MKLISSVEKLPMKSLLVSIFLTFLLTPCACLLAQSMGTARIAHTQAPETLHLQKRTTRLNPLATAIAVTIDTNRLYVTDANQVQFLGTITNTSGKQMYLSFRRRQIEPPGWSSSLCFGSSCYQNTVDTMGETFQPGESRSLIVDSQPALEEKPDSNTVFVTLYAASGNPADTVQLILHTYFQPRNPPIIFNVEDSKVHWASGLGGGQPHQYKPIIKNLAGTDVMYHFSLQNERMPTGWSASMCVVDSCQFQHVDVWHSLGPFNSATFNPVAKITLVSTPLIEKDSAIFYLRVQPQTENHADSAIYRYVAILNDLYFSHAASHTFAGAGEHSDTGIFQSYSGAPSVFHYSMQSILPSGWTSRFCVADSCSSGQDIRYAFGANGTATDHDSIAFFITSQPVTAKDSAILNFHIYKESNPADSANYTIIEYVNPQDAVAETPMERAGIAVTNAWPNPLILTARLNLEVMTDNPGHAVAMIYDMAGAEKAEIDLGELTLGINRIQLGNLNVPSGDYIIRIAQGEVASEPVRINCLK